MPEPFEGISEFSIFACFFCQCVEFSCQMTSQKIVLEQTFFLIWFFSFYRNAMHEYLANLSVWKFPTAGKWKKKKSRQKLDRGKSGTGLVSWNFFFSMARPRGDGSILTFFWLKYFITMTLLGGFLLKYLKLWLFVFWWPLLIKLTFNNILIKMKKSA